MHLTTNPGSTHKQEAIHERPNREVPTHWKPNPDYRRFFVADCISGEWSFISSSAPEGVNEYWIAVEDICKSPEALIDWIAHLNEKTWFSPQKFTDFFSRFREENSLYGAL